MSAKKPLDFRALIPQGTPFSVMYLQTTDEGTGGEVGLFFRMPIDAAAQFPLGATGVIADPPIPNEALVTAARKVSVSRQALASLHSGSVYYQPALTSLFERCDELTALLEAATRH